MKNRFVIFVVVAVAFVIAGIGIAIHRIDLHHPSDPLSLALIELKNPVKITGIGVLSGNEFDLNLADERRIHGILDVHATPDAKIKVLEFLNRCKNPRCVLQKQVNDSWIIQLYVTTVDAEGAPVEVEVSKWLRDKRLVYD